MTTNNSLWRQIAKNLGVVGSQFSTTNSILKQIARVRGVTNLEQTDNALLRQIARTYGLTSGLTTDNSILKLIARNLGKTTGLTTDKSILKLIRGELHPDTANYLSRVAAAGGTVSASNQLALDMAIRSIYSNNLRGSTNFLKYWLCLILTNSFTGCTVPVFDDGVGNPTNNNFVAGDWSPTLGLTGDGINKSLNLNYNPSVSLGTFSYAGRSDFHFGVYRNSFALMTPLYSTHGGIQMAAGAVNNLYFPYGAITNDENYVELWRTQSLYSAPAFTGKFLMINAAARDNARLVGDGSLLVANTTDSAAVGNPNHNLYLFSTYNYEFNYEYGWIDKSIAMATFGYGLSPTQETALYGILNTLRIALGA